MDSEEQAELRAGFDQFDTDHDGLMQMGEFVRFITGLDPNMSSEDCRIGFEVIDNDRNGVISFAEFVQWRTSP